MGKVWNKTKGLLRETRGNIVVELAKVVGGSSMLNSVVKFLSNEIHHVDHEWFGVVAYFIVGLVLLIAAFVLQKSNVNTPADFSESVPKGKDEDEAALQAQIHELETEVLRFKSIFSPFQMEIFELAQELQEFFDLIGPRPALPPRLSPAAYANIHIDQIIPWTNKLSGGYHGRFEARLKALRHRLAENNQVNFEFDAMIEGGAKSRRSTEDSPQAQGICFKANGGIELTKADRE
jgi:hypothetical protein